MKRKIVGTLLTLTVVSVTACGTQIATATKADALEKDSIVIESETGLVVEDTPVMTETQEFETAGAEPVYTEYEDLFFIDNFSDLNTQKLDAVDKGSLKAVDEKYYLVDSLNLYGSDGTWMGYSKPDIMVTLLMADDKWAEILFANFDLYVPKESFDLVAMAETDVNALLAQTGDFAPRTEQPKVETPKASEPVVSQPPATEPVVAEPEPVVESTKYTPEEAIAVYRSIMEANGIEWDPSIKEFASWGTGWIYLDKGQPEWAGNSSVEAFKMGGGDATHPWTKYYLEVTGSDENAVYYTKWSCD